MHPEFFWIDGPWPGRLAIVPRPRGGDWLEDDVRAWRRAGLDAVVSTLTPEEEAEFALIRERDSVIESGLIYRSLPIPDNGVPRVRRTVLQLLRELEELLNAGKSIGIHCRQGIGRSALIACSLLVLGGVDVEVAINRVAAARGRPVPETQEQRQWIVGLARHLAGAKE
jgi:protein-tyrosine phosphatase